MENLKALYRGGTGPEDATVGNLKTVTGEPLPKMPPKMGGARRRKSRKSKKSKKSKSRRR